jgi:hypothetical protein
MGERNSASVVHLEAAQARLRDHFLGWQCRVRQYAVRHAAGRPTSGMRPAVTLAGDDEALGQITVLIHKQAPEEITAQFRHMVLKTQDPAERWEGAIRVLQAAYFQRAREFSDVMTALFGPGSRAAARLSQQGRCLLTFEQYNQGYCVPCKVRRLGESEPLYQATYWHNSLFNPSLPAGIAVLAFTPDWAHAAAEPPVT